MIKRMFIMLVIMALVLGGVFGFIRFKGQMIKQFMTAGGIPVQTVSTMTASALEWDSTLQTIGTVRAVQGVDVSAEVAGLVEKIYFQQGDQVKAGMPLLKLRDNQEAAKLKSLLSTAELARITYQRDKAQLAVHAVSQQVVDTDKAQLDMALANVAEQKALLAQKLILAPFDGQLGLRHIDVGQYLTAGTPIVTLQNLQHVFVDFFMPQQALAVLKMGQGVIVKTEIYPEQPFQGEVTVINPKVDIKTRNVEVRAILTNTALKLRPGLYVTVDIDTGNQQKLITLPRTAISFNPYGSLVYRVEANGKDDKGQAKLMAKQVFVKTGATRGDQIAIVEGLREGDVVVTSGQIKLRNGTPVSIDNSVQPKNNAAPNLVDY